jgi:DNA-3-methyladenine glycosylase I
VSEPRRGTKVDARLGGLASGTARPRCPWPVDDALMLRYHDEEWGTPVHDDTRHFEFLLLDGAQAGLSWRTILHKRENYRAVFAGFDPRKVARFDARKIERLLLDPGIVRNRLKVEGAIVSAKAFLRVQKEFGSFDAYVWSFTGGKTIVNQWESFQPVPAKTPESEAMSKDLLQRGFKFVGPTICYAYMQAAGMVNDHLTWCFRWREVQGLR